MEVHFGFGGSKDMLVLGDLPGGGGSWSKCPPATTNGTASAGSLMTLAYFT